MIKLALFVIRAELLAAGTPRLGLTNGRDQEFIVVPDAWKFLSMISLMNFE